MVVRERGGGWRREKGWWLETGERVVVGERRVVSRSETAVVGDEERESSGWLAQERIVTPHGSLLAVVDDCQQ
jgi:hypothetical protein